MAEIDEIIGEPSESQKRITELSGQKKAAEEKALAAEAKAQEAERLAQFSDGFTDIVAENPQAKEFKDQIKEKVMGGMSIEDAKFAVLGKAGKLNPVAPVVETMTAAGGSASTGLPQGGGEKTPAEMTQAERRAALMEREGELQGILAPRINT